MSGLDQADHVRVRTKCRKGRAMTEPHRAVVAGRRTTVRADPRPLTELLPSFDDNRASVVTQRTKIVGGPAMVASEPCDGYRRPSGGRTRSYEDHAPASEAPPQSSFALRRPSFALS